MGAMRSSRKLAAEGLLVPLGPQRGLALHVGLLMHLSTVTRSWGTS